MELKKNFVIFHGKTFLGKIKEFYEPDSEEVAECNEGTVEGYMSGMVSEGATRLNRDLINRQTQVGE